MGFISKPLRTAELCGFIRISESILILRNNAKSSHIHDVLSEIGNICFMLKRKSFSVSQGSKVFDDIV